MSKWIKVSERMPPIDKFKDDDASITVFLKTMFRDQEIYSVGCYIPESDTWHEPHTGKLLEIKWWDDREADVYEPTHWCEIPGVRK